jgi:hypothetical protein
MIALVLWLAAPPSLRFLPHPIYLAWTVSIATFFLVAIFDHRPIRSGAG